MSETSVNLDAAVEHRVVDLVDIESALGLAQQQAELTGSVQSMLAALQTAQKRLAKVPQPRLAPVMRAIQHDIERLQSASTTIAPRSSSFKPTASTFKPVVLGTLPMLMINLSTSSVCASPLALV